MDAIKTFWGICLLAAGLGAPLDHVHVYLDAGCLSPLRFSGSWLGTVGSHAAAACRPGLPVIGVQKLGW